VKGAAKYWLIALLAAALIVAGGLGAAWIAGTTEGARWFMDTVSRHTPLAISVRTVEGRLIDRLHLGGVRLTLAPLEVEIESLDYRWQPLLLLSGKIAVKELTLAKVHVRDNSPGDTPPDLAWPRVSGMAAFFGCTVERLQVSGLSYRRLDGQPVSITAISSSASWRSALLSLSDLAVASPAGRVAGNIAADFDHPSLRFDLVVTPAKPAAGMDVLSLQGRLHPGRDPEQAAGGFTVAGYAGKVKRLELAGEAGMTRNAFNLRQLRLSRPGRRGAVTGGGTITLTAQEPLLAFQLLAAGIDLTPELNAPTDLSGTLTFTGTPERYKGEFNIANRGQGWQEASLSGSFQGDSRGVRVAPVNGSLLAGSVQGSLDLGWDEEFSLKGAIRGRDLNPAGIAHNWAGVVNFDLAGDVVWPSQALLRGKVSGRLLESRLHGQALTGEVQADFAGDSLHVGRLALRGKGFDITAAGDLDKRLAFALQIVDLSRLVPETAGKLRADGWVSWRDGRLEGAVTGRGGKLAAGGLQIAAANLTAQLGEGKGYPLHVSAKLHKVAYGRFQADAATIEADGTALRHTVHAALSSAEAEARIALAGGYNRGSWQGEIVRFSGRDSIGPWSLAAPAPLSASAGKITLAPLILTGVQPERIEIAGEITLAPLGGSVRVVWGGLNLARANRWLTEVRVTGASAGNVQLRLAAGERPAFSGSIGASGTVTAEKYGVTVQQGSLSLDGGNQGMRVRMELRLAGGGMMNGALSSPAPARLAIPEIGYITAEWADIDLALLRRWLPDDVILTGSLAGQITGNILNGERLDLTGKASLARGNLRWKKENEAFDAALHTAELTLGWQGALRGTASERDAGQLAVAGRIGASGVLTLAERRISIERIALSLDGNDRGMHAKMDLSLAGGGIVNGRFSSPRPARLAIPTEGEADLEWTGIDLLLIRPWLPSDAKLEGRLVGRATGKLLPGQRFSLKGDTTLSGGKARWLRPEGEINVNGRSATLSLDWQEEALRGAVTLALAEQGQLRGSFQLPLPARFPAVLDRKMTLQASLTGQVLEKGVLASFFPGFVQESSGEIDVDLRIGGTWDDPKIEGSLKLAKAGAYLPTAGIHIRDVQLAMRLEKDLVRIDSVRAVSGSGHIEGTALVRLKGWQVVGYQGSINGERFQTIYLPELQILSTPRLTFEGTPKTLILRGEVRLPELLIFGPPTRAVVPPSRDVILEGAPKPVEKAFPLALDVQVRITLGEKVLVKMEGIDAQLDGGTDLMFKSLDKITSKGEIKVVKGRYRAYGVNLEIVRGRLFYTGGSISQPTLDILALRTVGDVRAGITVSGILQAPVIKLYSEPTLPAVDILAYIVFGHPFDNSSNSKQAAMMAQVASALLSRDQSSSLQDQIKNRLGLSTMEIQTSSTESAGRMGYKEIGVSPTGAKPARQGEGVSDAMLTVGKYLTPQLYLSYGRSLYTGGNQVRLRYDLFKQWQIETETGSESSVDLYYKIEFH
jgi:translocation and assembly module TamB